MRDHARLCIIVFVFYMSFLERLDSASLDRICSKIIRAFKRGKAAIRNRHHQNRVLLSSRLYQHAMPDSSQEQTSDNVAPILYDSYTDCESEKFVFRNLHVPQGKFPDLRSGAITEEHQAEGRIAPFATVTLEAVADETEVLDCGCTYQGIVPLLLSMFA